MTIYIHNYFPKTRTILTGALFYKVNIVLSLAVLDNCSHLAGNHACLVEIALTPQGLEVSLRQGPQSADLEISNPVHGT